MPIEPVEEHVLPLGLELDGTRYRDIVIDETCGVDDENVASPKVRNNGARAMSLILRRVIQEIPGLLPRKKNRYGLIDERYVREMYALDRDYLFIATQVLADKDALDQPYVCPLCGDRHDGSLALRELDVYEWDVDKPPYLELTLPKGYQELDSMERHTEVKWLFPKGTLQEQLAKQAKEQLTTSMIVNCLRIPGLESKDNPEGKPSTEAVRRMSTTDRSHLSLEPQNMLPGVDLWRHLSCDSCGHAWKLGVNLSSLFRSGSADDPKTTSAGKSGGGRTKRR